MKVSRVRVSRVKVNRFRFRVNSLKVNNTSGNKVKDKVNATDNTTRDIVLVIVLVLE